MFLARILYTLFFDFLLIENKVHMAISFSPGRKLKFWRGILATPCVHVSQPKLLTLASNSTVVTTILEKPVETDGHHTFFCALSDVVTDRRGNDI